MGITGASTRAPGLDGDLPEALQRHDPHIVEQVCNDVLDHGANIGWADIAGLETAKKLIQEMVVWPMQNPHLFKVHRFCWDTVYIYNLNIYS